MTPFASVAMLEKLALLKIALCKAPAFSRASVCPTSTLTSAVSAAFLRAIDMCPRFYHLLIVPLHRVPSTECHLKTTSRSRALASGNLAAGDSSGRSVVYGIGRTWAGLFGMGHDRRGARPLQFCTRWR